MNRRGFTLAGFFGTLGAAISKALAFDGTPRTWTPLPDLRPPADAIKPKAPFKRLSEYTIKIGRKVMRVSPDDGSWEVYADTAETAVRSHEGADVLERIDQESYKILEAVYAKTPPFGKPYPLQSRERLSLQPEGLERWNESPAAVRPMLSGTKIDIRHFRDDLEHILTLKDLFAIRGAVHELYSRADAAIRRQESFCNGHNGPALGLTAEHCMTEMNDGRRLCPYCYNQEIQDGRSAVTS